MENEVAAAAMTVDAVDVPIIVERCLMPILFTIENARSLRCWGGGGQFISVSKVANNCRRSPLCHAAQKVSRPRPSMVRLLQPQ